MWSLVEHLTFKDTFCFCKHFSWVTPRNSTPSPKYTAKTVPNHCWSDPLNRTWVTVNRLPDFAESSKPCWPWNVRKSHRLSTTMSQTPGFRPWKTVGCLLLANLWRGMDGMQLWTQWVSVDTMPTPCWKPMRNESSHSPRIPFPGWSSGLREPKARLITCWTR